MPQILTAAANRRVADIQYASVTLQVDLSSVTDNQEDKLELNMVAKLPMKTRLSMMGMSIILSSILSKGRMISIEEWETIREVTKQAKAACSLKTAAFSNTQAIPGMSRLTQKLGIELLKGAWLG